MEKEMKDSYLRSKEVQRVHALAISACTYRGVVAFPPGARLAPRVHDIYIQLCPGDTVEARPGCSFRDMLWSPTQMNRPKRNGKVEVVSVLPHLQRPPIYPYEKGNSLGDFRGRPH
jgi:hypothetical protein